MLSLPDVDFNGADVIMWKDEKDHFWAGPCTNEGREFFTREGVSTATVAVEVIVPIYVFLNFLDKNLTLGVLMDDGKVGRITQNRLQ